MKTAGIIVGIILGVLGLLELLGWWLQKTGRNPFR
jgi:hypothetical protein